MSKRFFVLSALGGSIAAAKYYSAGASNYYNSKLQGKTVVIAGTPNDVALEICRRLSFNGARVYFFTNDKNKYKDTVTNIVENNRWYNKEEPPLQYKKIDLKDFETVQGFTKEFERTNYKIDILVNLPDSDHEPTPGSKTNAEVIGNLTNSLSNLLSESGEGRVINLVSYLPESSLSKEALQKCSDNFDAGKQTDSSWALVGLAKNQQKQFDLEHKHIKVVAVNPGLSRHELDKKATWLKSVPVLSHLAYWLVAKSNSQAAQTALFASMYPWKDLQGGELYSECKLVGKESLADKPKAMAQANIRS